MVALFAGNNLLCTGTLVAPTWVLTAAHCLDPASRGLSSQDQVTANTEVHIGTLDVFRQPGTRIRASATFKDPQFQELGSHDVGLIELASAVTDIEPSPINFSAARAPVGTVVTFVGYGVTARMGGTAGVQLQLEDRTSVSCPSLGIGTDADLLCFSQADSRGTCTGDSGGPAFAMIDGKRTVVGVTSFGDLQCAEFAGMTRVDIEQGFLLMQAPDVAGCFEDADCPQGRVCFTHHCIAEPFGPTGLGTVCTAAEDCESLQCAESSRDGKRCSVRCSVADETSCPDGFECLRGDGDASACWPLTAGGCCDAGGGGPGSLVLGIVSFGLVRRRKRR